MALSGVLSVQDITAGAGPWRNIPAVIRSAVRELVERSKAQEATIRSNAEAIARLQQAMEQRPTSRDVEGALASKADDALVARRLADLNRVVDAKADASAVEERLGRMAETVQAELMSVTAQQAECATRMELERAKEEGHAAALVADELAKRMDHVDKMVDAAKNTAEAAQRAVANKSDRREFTVALEQLSSTLETTMREVQGKADAKDFAEEMSVLSAKISRELSEKANIRDVNEVLAGKASRREIQEIEKHAGNREGIARAVEERMGSIKTDIREIQDQLERKADHRDVDAMQRLKLDRSAATAFVDAEYVNQRVRDVERAMKEDLGRRKSKEKEGISDEVQRVLELRKVEAARIESRVEELGRAVERMHGEVDGISRLQKRVETVERQQPESLREEVKAWMGEFARVVDVNKALSLKANVRDVNRALGGLEVAEEESVVVVNPSSGGWKEALHMLERKMETKAEMGDVCVLLDAKADAKDTKMRLDRVNERLARCVTGKELHPVAAAQSISKGELRESYGRWLWKSGKIRKSSKAIPWNVQMMNTAPGNFVWHKDRSSVLCVSGGLYEITFAVYADKTPSVQLLVNGEPVLSAVNSSSYVLHHSSGRLAPTGHPMGNITGLSLVDFLALPPRARISISYAGVSGGQAFLGLKKL